MSAVHTFNLTIAEIDLVLFVLSKRHVHEDNGSLTYLPAHLSAEEASIFGRLRDATKEVVQDFGDLRQSKFDAIAKAKGADSMKDELQKPYDVEDEASVLMRQELTKKYRNLLGEVEIDLVKDKELVDAFSKTTHPITFSENGLKILRKKINEMQFSSDSPAIANLNSVQDKLWNQK